ncbi:MAG: TetR/AcrR family transcriptional regulator [Deltaproteobacteria bacterium]|nr:TetR/AcrR family transcriptional regulator [Deltaproteobacteria bacterium]
MRGDNKRGKILEAAVKVFARNGFYQSKVSEIAREAEVADGTIYLYFHNKDDILINLFEEEMTRIIEAMKAIITREEDPVRQLEEFAQAHLGLVKKNKELAEVIQVEIRQSSKFMKEYDNKKFAEYLDLISAIIQEGQRKGVFRGDIHPGIAKRAIFGALDELSRLLVLSPLKEHSISMAAQQISGYFLEGMTTNHKQERPKQTDPTPGGGRIRKGGKSEHIGFN